jgi:hypothetical protein
MRRARIKSAESPPTLGDPLALARLMLEMKGNTLPWRSIARDLAKALITTTAERDAVRRGAVATNLTEEERASLDEAVGRHDLRCIGEAPPRQLAKIILALVAKLERSTCPSKQRPPVRSQGFRRAPVYLVRPAAFQARRRHGYQGNCPHSTNTHRNNACLRTRKYWGLILEGTTTSETISRCLTPRAGAHSAVHKSGSMQQ